MSRAPIVVFVAAALSFGAFEANAQPRDGVLREQAIEEESSKCLADPECSEAVRIQSSREQQRMATIQAGYEAKPWYLKLAGWLAIPGIFFALWWLAGRGGDKKK